MKIYWDDRTEALIKEYNTDTPNREEIALKLLKQNPLVFKYLLTTLDSIIGNHQVYLVTFENENLNGMFKIGYTKHKDIKKRFGEKRWGKKLIIKKIIKQDELPALGAIEFEKHIISNYPPNATFDGSNPGKNEFYEMSQLDSVLELWNKNLNHYKNIVGIKAPN